MNIKDYKYFYYFKKYLCINFKIYKVNQKQIFKESKFYKDFFKYYFVKK